MKCPAMPDDEVLQRRGGGETSRALMGVRCQNCGKLSQYSAADVGMVALCVACGQRFVVPGDPHDTHVLEAIQDAPPVESPPPTPTTPDVPATPTEVPLAPAVTRPTLVRRAEPEATFPSPLFVIGLALTACAAVVVIVVAFASRPGSWGTAFVADARHHGDAAPRRSPGRTEGYETVRLTPVLPPVIEPAPAPPPPPSTSAPTTAPAAEPESPRLPRLPRPRIVVRPHPGAVVDDSTAGVTDEAIGRSINAGVNFLLARFQRGLLRGEAVEGQNSAYAAGADALCVYALVQAGLATRDERLNPKGSLVREMVDKMKAMPADAGTVTYARGIRATALALLARPEDRAALKQDVDYLLTSHVGGAYTYARPAKMPKGQEIFAESWDNSNSQYGLLGVWSAAEVGAEVNSNYWQAVEEHWTRTQLPNGAWDYMGGGPRAAGGTGRLSMTLAGVASLFVTHDYLDARRQGGAVGRDPFSKPLALGLNYLETGDNAMKVESGSFTGYTLYGLERVGLASGFKFLGRHDWYREQAAAVVARQHADGSWGSEIETAYHLLFLARGRHPILMNKLRFAGYWANRPRDVANLARFGSKELERPLNWQVVPIDRDWTDWMDAPILYIASHKRVALDTVELGRLRSYVEAGGMIFTQADGGSAEANTWAEELARKLFPTYEMADLPADHELFSILYKPADRPPLRYLTNGSRILMIHSPTDISRAWQMRQDRTRRGLFELGLNLFLYASGKADLRNRLASPVIPEPQAPATGGRVAVARVRYPGNWDPEPAAWPRFARYFQRQTDVSLVASPTDLAHLNPLVAAFAHWTGTAAYTPTDEEVDAIRRYVTGGGVLLVEPCGGSGEFLESARAALRRAFPDAPPHTADRTDPLLTASGPGMDDVSTPHVRPYVDTRGLGESARLDLIPAGRGTVILSPLDLTTGLLGCNTWGILGFDPDDALRLTKNAVLWSATGMAEGR
jgi:hypothetical protein